MSARVSLRGMLMLIRADTLRRVHTCWFSRGTVFIYTCIIQNEDIYLYKKASIVKKIKDTTFGFKSVVLWAGGLSTE